MRSIKDESRVRAESLIELTRALPGRLGDWAREMHPELATLSWIYASGADVIHEASRLQKPFQGLVLRYPIAEWVRCYRSHRLVRAGLWGPFGKRLKEAIESGFDIQAAAAVPAEDAAAAMFAEFKCPSEDDEDDEFLDGYDPTSNVASAFFLAVALPCWWLYRVSWTSLLRRARHGGVAAIRDLYRLDPTVIHEAGVANAVRTMAIREPKKHGRLCDLLRGVHLQYPRSHTVRVRIAGFLCAFWKSRGEKMGPAAVERLFSAIARERGAKQDTDPLIDTTGETFARQVNREMRAWGSSPPGLMP